MNKSITISWGDETSEVTAIVSGSVSAQEAMLNLCTVMSDLIVKYAPPDITADEACERMFAHILVLVKEMALDINEAAK